MVKAQIIADKNGFRYQAPGPRLNRSVTLRLQGDWGGANFHRVCGWLTQEFCERAGRYSRCFIGNSTGQADSLRAVHRGKVDVAITTPLAALPMAVRGEGFMRGEACADLRALAVVPQRDILALALGKEFGVRSFEDLRKLRPALRLAVPPDDGFNYMGYIARRFMEACGVPETTLKEWGGSYVSAERPEIVLEFFREGQVDGVIMEAIMAPWWRQVAEKRDMVFVPIPEDVLQTMERQYSWPRRVLHANTFPNQPEDVWTLDYSHFVVFCRDDLPEDVAHLLTWCLVETRDLIEVQYRHLAPERSPITYPLDPVKMARSPLPLHPGAERYYREAGLLT
jgi:TRAP transporter TAXI family solute receptor